MKLCKNNGITHINNSWQIQVEAGHFACPMPYRWRGDVTVDTQCFLTNITQTLRIFSYFLHKNFTQSLRRHHANIITLDTDFYADITQYIYADFMQNYASITQIVNAKYAYITQIRLRSTYAIISVLRN